MTDYYDDLDTVDKNERENKKFSILKDRLIFINKNSIGWNKILKGIDLQSIKDRYSLEKIPVTRKSSLLELQKSNPPFAGFNIKKPNFYPYIFASPGPIYEPAEQGDFWNMGRALYAADFRKNDIAYNTFSYHLGPAGLMFHNSAQSIGCSVIPGGVGSTELQINTISDLKPNKYIGTPSFLKILLDKSKENNVDISSIKKGLVGAEALPSSLRLELKEQGVFVLQTYGTAETGCISYETLDNEGKLIPGMIVDENIIIEIVRPGTSENVKLGEVGEVVITKVNSTYPMIRIGTGDMSAIIAEPSPCGRTNLRIKGWMGRSEQSTKVRGLFVTPEQINLIVKSLDCLHKARLIIDRTENKDQMVLVCEVSKFSDDLENKIIEIARSVIKMRTAVKIVEKKTIPNDGKVIEDKRVYS